MVEIEQDLKTKRSSIKSFIKYLFCYCWIKLTILIRNN
jgi:hypothetical protein